MGKSSFIFTLEAALHNKGIDLTLNDDMTSIETLTRDMIVVHIKNIEIIISLRSSTVRIRDKYKSLDLAVELPPDDTWSLYKRALFTIFDKAKQFFKELYQQEDVLITELDEVEARR